jgi:hypothetical protein
MSVRLSAGLPFGLLRTHVRSGAKDGAGCREIGWCVIEPFCHRFCETEIENLQRAIGADLDVRRFQVAMDDAAVVRMRQRVGQLAAIANHLVERQPAVGNQRVERRSVHELHDDEGPLADLAHFMDRADIWVIQRGRRACFAQEALTRTGIAECGRRKNLDRDVSIQLWVERAIHLSHPAGADQQFDAVTADRRAGRERRAVFGVISGAIFPRDEFRQARPAALRLMLRGDPPRLSEFCAFPPVSCGTGRRSGSRSWRASAPPRRSISGSSRKASRPARR